MKSIGMLLLGLVGAALSSSYAAPSAEALTLTEKLRIREFDRFLKPPSRLTEAQLETLKNRFGIDALMLHVAAYFDENYSPEQIKGMLALWNDPHMPLLVASFIGTEAPINRLLSKWSSERQQLITQLRGPLPPTAIKK